MFRATWKETNPSKSTEDESPGDILSEIQKREQKSDVSFHKKSNQKRSKQGINNESKRSKKSGNIFSPHESVYQALNDPNLNSNHLSGKVGTLTKETLRMLDGDSVNGSQFQFSFTKSKVKSLEENSNLDFSITSWQNISTNFEIPNDELISSNKLHVKTPLTLSTDQVNVISSGNNSPTYRNDEMLVLSPNRTESPNAGSILSSSSGQEEDKTIEKILDQNDAVIRSKSIFEKKKKRDFLSDDDGESIDTDLEKTVDSSTITSSFVMPKVSILSNSNTDVNRIGVKSVTKIKIIGDNDERLLKRFQTYKKTLTKIEFISSTNEIADLLIIVVDENNYMMPKLTNSYCIPIVLSKSKLHLVKKIPKAFKLCGPIHLSSLDDNLIHLINFLSNINNLQFWKKFISSVENNQTSQCLTITDLNKSLVGFQSRINTELKSIKENSESSDKNGKGLALNTYAIVALAVGAISMSVFVFIRTLANNNLSLMKIDQNDSKLLQPTNIESGKQLTEKLNDYLMLGLKQFQRDLDETFTQFISKSLLYYHKTKLLLHQYFNF